LVDFTAGLDVPDPAGSSALQPFAVPAQHNDERNVRFGRLSSRLFDVSIVLILLPFILPVGVIVALLILLSDRGPILFAHRRVGSNGRPFYCLKFRTMVPNCDQHLALHLAADPLARDEWHQTRKLARDPRVTRLGAWLRKLSLDELPQFLNVLRGEMSVVGPRPIVEAEVANYGAHVRYYLAVRPGITGLWQVSGRNKTSYRRRVVLDRRYVQIRSVALDLGILLRTIPAVLTRTGC